jgi:outer membrane protein assembly factor BamB
MLERHGLEMVWWSQATLNASRDTVRHFTVDEDLLYVQATSGVVTAFDNETGKRLWSIQLGRTDHPSFPVTSNDRMAMVVAGMEMYALNKFTGKILWQLRLPGMPSTSPAADDLQIYIGTLDGSVYAFDIRKIYQLYKENRLPAWSYQAINWRYQTGQQITTPPISTGLVVNFASRDRSLYSVTARRRKLRFQFEMNKPVSAPLAYLHVPEAEKPEDEKTKAVTNQEKADAEVSAQDLLYMASEDFNFYCLYAQNGTVRWEVVSGLPVRKAPVVVSEDVFVMPDNGGMYCIPARTGPPERWWRPGIVEFLAATQSQLYASDQLGNVVLLDRGDGAVIGALPLRHFSVRMANDRTDRLYLSTPSGLVCCIREQGREFPVYHKYPDRRPILPEFEKEVAEPPAAGIPPAENAPAM